MYGRVLQSVTFFSRSRRRRGKEAKKKVLTVGDSESESAVRGGEVGMRYGKRFCDVEGLEVEFFSKMRM
jgi:hypothetical protein